MNGEQWRDVDGAQGGMVNAEVRAYWSARFASLCARWILGMSIAATGLGVACTGPIRGAGGGDAVGVVAQEDVGIERPDGRFTALVVAGTALPASGLRTLPVERGEKRTGSATSEISVVAESTAFPPVRRVLGRFSVPDPAPGSRSLLLVSIAVDRAGAVVMRVQDGALSMPKNLVVDRIDGAAAMTIQVGPE